MHLHLLLVMAAGLFVAGFASTVNNCPSGVPRNKYLKVHGNACYQFVFNQKKEFGDARGYCKRNEGELVLLKTKKMNNYIRNTIRGLKHAHAKVWIGMEYDYKGDDFIWEDGTEVEFNNFGNKPSAFQDDCVFLDVSSGKWFTHDCDASYEKYAKHFFVCQYPMTTPPPVTNNDCPNSLPKDRYLQAYGQKCYRFALKQSDHKTFKDAQDDCQKDGGHLVLAKTLAINKYIQGQLELTYRDYEEVWIGLRYDYDADEFLWVDGSLLGYDYDNFQPNEYSKSDDCVAMGPYGGWVVKNCDDENEWYYTTRPYVCEYVPSSSSQHTTRASSSSPFTKTTPPYTEWTTGTPRIAETTASKMHTDFTTPYVPEITTAEEDRNFTTPSGQEMTTAEENRNFTTPYSPEMTKADENRNFTTPYSPEMTTAEENRNFTTPYSPEMTTAEENRNFTTPYSPEMTTAEENRNVTTPSGPEMTTAEENSNFTTSYVPDNMTTAEDNTNATAKNPPGTPTNEEGALNTTTPESFETNSTSSSGIPDDVITINTLDNSSTAGSKDNNTTTTIQSVTVVVTTCPQIVCELECGLDGYSTDKQTGCMECKCNTVADDDSQR